MRGWSRRLPRRLHCWEYQLVQMLGSKFSCSDVQLCIQNMQRAVVKTYQHCRYLVNKSWVHKKNLFILRRISRFSVAAINITTSSLQEKRSIWGWQSQGDEPVTIAARNGGRRQHPPAREGSHPHILHRKQEAENETSNHAQWCLPPTRPHLSVPGWGPSVPIIRIQGAFRSDCRNQWRSIRISASGGCPHKGATAGHLRDSGGKEMSKYSPLDKF